MRIRSEIVRSGIVRPGMLGAMAPGLCVLAACQGSGPSAAVDGAIDRTGDAAGDSSTAICGADVPAGQACNALAVTGPGVTPTCTTGTLPTGQGGTIVDGTYVLTAQTYYNASSCPTFALMETVEFGGGCLQIASGPPPFDLTASGTFTVAGTNITLTRTCVHLDGATFMDNGPIQTFTATRTTFTLFTQRTTASDPSSDSSVFTKL